MLALSYAYPVNTVLGEGHYKAGGFVGFEDRVVQYQPYLTDVSRM